MSRQGSITSLSAADPNPIRNALLSEAVGGNPQIAKRIERGVVRTGKPPRCTGVRVIAGLVHRALRVTGQYEDLPRELRCAVIAADEHRRDIARWKGTDGRHGFRWRLPEELAAGDGVRIDVFDAETGRPVPGSPLRASDGQVVASRQRDK